MHPIYLHPLPVRLWHWINALGCVVLFLTGIQLRYVGLIDVVSFRTAVQVHNVTGFVVAANFLLWLGYYVSSPRIRTYHAELNPVKYFVGSVRQALYYSYGIFRELPPPFRPTIYHKFNALQAMTYQILMIIVLPLQILSGLLLWNLLGFSHLVAFFGGVRVIDTVHVLVFVFFGFYIPAHIYLGTLGRKPLTHYKEMITGYEEEEGADAAE
ncbi:MAG TPA: cytochrome b/b6 domain-containing protein [Acetobacteraceae bacterium]|nr:cytochrome b/b6 domain-containing protein [Acetobacteraceae bacterium]